MVLTRAQQFLQSILRTCGVLLRCGLTTTLDEQGEHVMRERKRAFVVRTDCSWPCVYVRTYSTLSSFNVVDSKSPNNRPDGATNTYEFFMLVKKPTRHGSLFKLLGLFSEHLQMLTSTVHAKKLVTCMYYEPFILSSVRIFTLLNYKFSVLENVLWLFVVLFTLILNCNSRK